MTTNKTQIKIIEHPYYNDILDTVERVVKTNKNGKMFITYNGEKKEVLNAGGVGFHVWIYPEKVKR